MIATTPSLHETTGIFIDLFRPIILGGELLYSINNEISSYSHQINVFGGYTEATFSINDTLPHLETWIQEGLGRHIVVYNTSGIIIWEGYVNNISVKVGALSISRGPLMNIANRVSLVYVPIEDPNTDPPILGNRTETTIAESSSSQALYGIIEKVIATGNCSNNATDGYIADQIRDTYLAENRYPETNTQMTIGESSSEMSVEIQCRGYMDWFNVYVFNDIITTFLITLTHKLIHIICAESLINNIFENNTDQISVNNLTTEGSDIENRIAIDIIKGILAYGDVNDARWLFGVYANRIPYYYIMPSTVEYVHHLASNHQGILTYPGGTDVKPWDVQVGKWIMAGDFLVGKIPEATNPRTDPRCMFIESLQFTAPYQLQINGGKITTLPQKLAQLGLGGIT